MTMDLVKPTDSIDQPDITSIDVDVIVAEGICNGCITGGSSLEMLHSCVEYVNGLVDPDVGGNEVEGILKVVLNEAIAMSKLADQLAREGKTVDEMALLVIGDWFTFDEIKQMKIEVYGSTVAWKAAMVVVEEV